MSVNQRRDNRSAAAERDGGKPANLFRGAPEPRLNILLTALSGTLPCTDRPSRQQVKEKLHQTVSDVPAVSEEVNVHTVCALH